MDKDELLRRGEASKALLENGMLNLAFEQALQGQFKDWLTTTPNELTKREEMYSRAQAIRDLRGVLRSYLTDAVTEARKIQRMDRRRNEI